MACNLNSSIAVGVLTALVMTLIIFVWIGPEKMERMNLTTGNIVLLIAVLFIISVSIDVFNQCYTRCNSLTSSLSYGVFTTALIYLFFSLFVQRIPVSEQSVIVFIINVLILAGLHSLTCNAIHKKSNENMDRIVYVYRQ
jgi:high-affinity Fe2+/Pb2+ permease